MAVCLVFHNPICYNFPLDQKAQTEKKIEIMENLNKKESKKCLFE